MLREIYTPYFEWLDKHFGRLASHVKRNQMSVEDVVKDYLSQSNNRQKFFEKIPDIYKNVDSFWKTNGTEINKIVNMLGGFRAKYGGDIGPQYDGGIIQRAGLYFDTILITDPLDRIKNLPTDLKIPEYYLIKYGIQQVLLQDLYLANCDPPIAILIPDYQTEKGNSNDITKLAMLDTIVATNDLFGTAFDELDDVKSFFSKFNSLQNAVDAIKTPELVFFDSNTPQEIHAQIDGLISRNAIDWSTKDDRFNPEKAQFLLFTIFGRLVQTNILLQSAILNRSSLVLDAPASYHWLRWKILANQNSLLKEWGSDSALGLSITNALLSEEFQWLSKVPIDGLVSLRLNGELASLRSIISQEISNITKFDFDDSRFVINKIDYNLSNALKKHQNEINQLHSKFRSELAISGTTFLLSLLAYFQPIVLPTSPEWIQMLPDIVGTTSFANLIKAVGTKVREQRILSSSPIGILWEAKKQD